MKNTLLSIFALSTLTLFSCSKDESSDDTTTTPIVQEDPFSGNIVANWRLERTIINDVDRIDQYDYEFRDDNRYIVTSTDTTLNHWYNYDSDEKKLNLESINFVGGVALSDTFRCTVTRLTNTDLRFIRNSGSAEIELWFEKIP